MAERKSVNNLFWRLLPTILVIITLTTCKLMPSSTTAHNDKNHHDSSSSQYGDLLDVKNPPAIQSFAKNYTGFRVDFNVENKTPNWVAWELLDSETDGPISRSNNFWQDEDVPNCPNSDDYKHSGYDRGHICPAADNKLTEQMMQDCFVMTNICPQAHALNSGAWKTLENKERLWAQRDKKLYIVAGPIYDTHDKQRIGQNAVRVPSAFFKVIIAPYIASPRGIGFIYPNMQAPGNMQNYSMTIDQVEEITGFDFFHNLPDELENNIESHTSFREWNRQ